MNRVSKNTSSKRAAAPRIKAESSAHLQIWDDFWGGLWRAQALAAAIDLDLFTHIERGNYRVAQIAAACGASERGARSLLDAMTGMGYLQKLNSESYRLHRNASEFLVRDKPLYMGDLAAVGKLLMMMWTTLAEAVRQGQHAGPERSAEDVAQFFTHWCRPSFPSTSLRRG